MEVVVSILLGTVQGLTEFIPVSSSGHLIFTREILGIETRYDLAYDAVLQLATSVAILYYFRKEFKVFTIYTFQYIHRYSRILWAKITKKRPSPDIDSPGGRDGVSENLLQAIAIGTLPAVVLGLLLQSQMETTFRSSLLVAAMLVVGGVLMWLSERMATQDKKLDPKKGLGIGFFQSLALIPGVSRSGATIAGGLLFGLERTEATRFSFMLGFPVLFGSGIYQLLSLTFIGVGVEFALQLLLGSLVAFAVGLIAMQFLLRYLRYNRLDVFVIYRFLLAFFIIISFT